MSREDLLEALNEVEEYIADLRRQPLGGDQLSCVSLLARLKDISEEIIRRLSELD